ncbi:unnamed protein product [Lathyrus oleraceus]
MRKNWKTRRKKAFTGPMKSPDECRCSSVCCRRGLLIESG